MLCGPRRDVRRRGGVPRRRQSLGGVARRRHRCARRPSGRVRFVVEGDIVRRDVGSDDEKKKKKKIVPNRGVASKRPRKAIFSGLFGSHDPRELRHLSSRRALSSGASPPLIPRAPSRPPRGPAGSASIFLASSNARARARCRRHRGGGGHLSAGATLGSPARRAGLACPAACAPCAPPPRAWCAGARTPRQRCPRRRRRPRRRPPRPPSRREEYWRPASRRACRCPRAALVRQTWRRRARRPPRC